MKVGRTAVAVGVFVAACSVYEPSRVSTSSGPATAEAAGSVAAGAGAAAAGSTAVGEAKPSAAGAGGSGSAVRRGNDIPVATLLLIPGGPPGGQCEDGLTYSKGR